MRSLLRWLTSGRQDPALIILQLLTLLMLVANTIQLAGML